MNETYQNRITDQICKIQTDKKLIAFYDKLLTTSYNSFAQLHAKGEYVEKWTQGTLSHWDFHSGLLQWYRRSEYHYPISSRTRANPISLNQNYSRVPGI